MDPAIKSNPMQPQSILDGLIQCLTSFEYYLLASIKDEQEKRSVDQLVWRLNIWSDYLGVRGRGGLALDERLRDYSDVKNAIISLLELIWEKLQDAIVFTEGAPNMTTSDTDNNDISEERAIQDRWRGYGGSTWEAIEMALDTLLELAATIKKSTVPMTAAHLDVHYSRPDDSYFPHLASTLARSRFPDARRSLTDQLGHSMHIRRKRILYQQRHHRKMSFQPPEKLPNIKSVEKSSLPLTAPKSMPYLGPPKLRLSIPNDAPSLTQASKIDGSLLHKRMKNRTVISSRNSGRESRREIDIDYPPRPEPQETAPQWCICPYCSRPLECAGLTPPEWRAHVEGDMQPYVCISEKCKTSYHFFSSQQEWVDHMNSFHGNVWYQRIHMTTWACNLGHQEQQEFNDENQFREHIVALHPDISELQMNSLARRSRGTGVRDVHVCPLCERIPQELSRGVDADLQQQLMDHIAGHLKSLAYFSLPSADRQVSKYDNKPTQNSDQTNSGFDANSLAERTSISANREEEDHSDQFALDSEISFDAADCNIEENWDNLNLPEKDVGDNAVLEHFKSLQTTQAIGVAHSGDQDSSSNDAEKSRNPDPTMVHLKLDYPFEILNMFVDLNKAAESYAAVSAQNGLSIGEIATQLERIRGQEKAFQDNLSTLRSENMVKSASAFNLLENHNLRIIDGPREYARYSHITSALQNSLKTIVEEFLTEKIKESQAHVHWNSKKVGPLAFNARLDERIGAIYNYNKMLQALIQRMLNSKNLSQDSSRICLRGLCPNCIHLLASSRITAPYGQTYSGSMIKFGACIDCWICMHIRKAMPRFGLNAGMRAHVSVTPMKAVPHAMVLLLVDRTDDLTIEICHIYQLASPGFRSTDEESLQLYLLRDREFLNSRRRNYGFLEKFRLAYDLVDSILQIYDSGLPEQDLELFSVANEKDKRPHFTFSSATRKHYGHHITVPYSSEPSLNWTLYVIAIQLIELWANKGVEDIKVQNEVLVNEESPFGLMCGKALQIAESGFLRDAGRSYEEAVKKCLSGDVACDVVGDMRLPEFRKAVREEVLSKLAEAVDEASQPRRR